MPSLEQLDIRLFRIFNQDLSNPVLDAIMPGLSGTSPVLRFFYPLMVAAAVLLVLRGKRRGLLCLLALGLVIAIGDGFICNTLKHVIGRERPFLVLEDVRCLVGKGGSGSMPSSHAANWFSAAMVAFIYYRRSAYFMLPAALLVSFSRVYNGIHYPSDVLMGAVLGAGYAAAIIWSLDALWQWVGRRWFPLWWAKLPRLLAPEAALPDSFEEEELLAKMPHKRGLAPAGFISPQLKQDAHWVRLGYVLIAVTLAFRLLYIAGHTIQLSEDEAYQWLWSKHLALSYYSKPLLIAVTQFLSTSIWGDTAFGVRFFSPVIAAILSVLVLKFFARQVNARAGFFLLLIMSATPLLAAGSVLLTIDPLSVLFWTLAMLAGWSAIQDKGTTSQWIWVGVWMGLGFLSKYTQLFQLLSWVCVFAFWRPARQHLRRPGPYLALLINALFMLPVIIWNAQRHWITVRHVAENAGAGKAWERTFVGDFLGAEFGLLNPVFFVATVWACVAFWKRWRQNPKLVYFFWMGAPLFLAYFVHSFRGRVLPNWIAPSVLPLFFVMVIYWDARWRLGNHWRIPWLTMGMLVGLVIVAFGYQTDLVHKLTGRYLPVHLDPLHRVREWDTTAQAVNQARINLMAEGKPVFIITDHYGMAGQISYHLPEAREAIRDVPLVYFRSSPVPLNQFYFWPGYTSQRKGQNAIFVVELDRKDPQPKAPYPILQSEFESVTDLGVTNVMYHGFLLRPLQLFACRNLR